MVAFDHAFKPAAFGDADRINIIAGRKKRGPNDLAGLHFLAEIAEFTNAFYGHAVEFLDMTEQSFGEALLFLIVKAELNGIISVTLLCFALKHAIRAGENDGDRRNNAFGI